MFAGVGVTFVLSHAVSLSVRPSWLVRERRQIT